MAIVTPIFRASYPNLFKPKLNELNGKEEYSVMALFPKGADLSPLKKLAQEALEEKWGKDKSKYPTNLRSPFRDQKELMKDGKMRPGTEDGAIFINLKAKQKPQVVDQNVQPILDQAEFYPGVFAKASVTAYAYDNKGNRGVAFGLGNIQKVKDGEPLSGRSRAQDDFAPIEATGTDSAEGLF